jgi:cytochrome P450
MVEETLTTIGSWRDGATTDVHRDMSALTLRIVVRTLLGGDIKPAEMDAVSEALARFTDHFDSRFNGLRFFIPDFVPTPGNLRTRAAVRRIDRIVYRLINERRAALATDPGDDVISMLLGARTEGGRSLTDREIRDEVMTLFLAGHETTALALTWTLYLLGRNPQARQRLEEELEQVLAGQRRPELADVPRLPYTEAVVNEAMRLYPPAYAVSREAIRPTQIGGHPMRKRQIALVSIHAAHRNRERFPDPDGFNPDRWLDGLARRLPKGAYVPFAEGPRKCIGAAFAMQEAILALATIASRARLEPTTDAEPGVIAAVTLRPAHPIRMRVVRAA